MVVLSSCTHVGMVSYKCYSMSLLSSLQPYRLLLDMAFHNFVSVCLDLIQGHFQSEMPLHKFDSQHLHSYGYLKLRIVSSELGIQNGTVSILVYSLSLLAAWSGDHILVGVRFSMPVQTGCTAHSAFCTVGTRSFWGKVAARAWSSLPTPFVPA
jgi:hypothetical protein